MAKLAEYKNPLTTTSGSVFSLSTWTGGILWVVMVGMVLAIGVSLVQKIDSILPGNTTPNVKPYAKAESVQGTTIL